MKTFYFPNSFVFAAIIAAATLQSCSSTDYISGEWLSGDSQIFLNDQSLADVDVTSRLTFTPDENDKKHGSLTIISDVVIRDQISTNDSLDLNYEITITAQTSISGKYAYEDDDDDDIVIALDKSTLTTSINPEAVTYGVNMATGQQQPQVETIDRRTIANTYSQQLRRAILDDYSKYTKLSDIKIKHTILSCEIGDRDYTFRRLDSQKE